MITPVTPLLKDWRTRRPGPRRKEQVLTGTARNQSLKFADHGKISQLILWNGWDYIAGRRWLDWGGFASKTLESGYHGSQKRICRNLNGERKHGPRPSQFLDMDMKSVRGRSVIWTSPGFGVVIWGMIASFMVCKLALKHPRAVVNSCNDPLIELRSGKNMYIVYWLSIILCWFIGSYW